MCGLAGILTAGAVREEHLDQMAGAVRHRGPDDQGIWLDSSAGIGLAHTRLSILDLSPAGHQPMSSASGRYMIAFNGEIYNHLDLRADLARAGTTPAWRGHSDTETLLYGIETWGIEGCVRRTVGMFAMAIWDRESRDLSLVRDRAGEKPLYYGWQGDTFLFGSDLRSLKAHPAFRGVIDRDALTLLMRHNYIPAPYSIYRGIRKQEPGTILRVSLEQRESRLASYWSVAEAVEAGFARPFEGSPDEAVDQLEALIAQAVRLQMISDVPLGAFLSGGVDSSTIVALMQKVSDRPVRTFTIGFHEAGFDEAIHARAVAAHLGTDHTELYVTAQQAQEVIPLLPRLYSEPFADSSQIPTYLVSALARQHVTVSLSGDAGDELFAGYDRYSLTDRLASRLGVLPRSMRRMLGGLIRAVSPIAWDRMASPVKRFLPLGFATRDVGDRLHKGARLLQAADDMELYRLLVSHWTEPASLVIGGREPPTMLTGLASLPSTPDLLQQLMAVDMVSYLPDDILAKVDRAAMGVSLETRVPLLDHRVIEFAWRLPRSYLVRDGQAKWPLRQVLDRHVPRQLIDRPKMGFGVPIDVWLRGPLRAWAEALLDPSRLAREGFFHAEVVQARWQEHLSGRRNWQGPLWNVLMFQAWLAEQGSPSR